MTVDEAGESVATSSSDGFVRELGVELYDWGSIMSQIRRGHPLAVADGIALEMDEVLEFLTSPVATGVEDAFHEVVGLAIYQFWQRGRRFDKAVECTVVAVGFKSGDVKDIVYLNLVR